MKKIGILGHGEIGKSISKIYQDFKSDFEVKIRDPYSCEKCLDDFEDIEILNICIPFKDEDNFINAVTEVMLQHNPNLTIIHSTTLPDVTNKIRTISSLPVVHSPVRGIHPNLYQALKTFVKYIGYQNEEEKELSKKHFESLKLKCDLILGSSNTELAKLYSTTYYGLCIAFHGEMKKHFDKQNLNFDIIKKWNETYNEGYEELGKKIFSRPNLIPPENNKIGGHCIIPNAELLSSIFESEALDFILKYK